MYKVTLTVMDSAGVTGTQTVTVDVNVPPTASFTCVCRGLDCIFDGSGSRDPGGPITGMVWHFGDQGIEGGGPIVFHRYNAGGTYTVTLIVTDNSGVKAQQQQTITITSTPPVALFVPMCIVLTCNFDASGSSDPDGIILSHAWNFGDGTSGSGVTASRTYTAAGTYAVVLTVTDNDGKTSTQSRSVTVVGPKVHVGELDGSRTSQQLTWTAIATIIVHDSSHGAVANAAIRGSWNNGDTASCTTTASGQCIVSKAGIPRRTSTVRFTVAAVTRAWAVYVSADNHDADADSNGTTVTINRP
jgi:PKD repeat protein